VVHSHVSAGAMLRLATLVTSAVETRRGWTKLMTKGAIPWTCKIVSPLHSAKWYMRRAQKNRRWARLSAPRRPISIPFLQRPRP